MTALALAVAVGRLIPELAETSHRWPYLAAGIGFALYGMALIGYGSLRRRRVDRALDEGRYPEPLGLPQAILVGSGLVLGLITILLVVID